MPDILYRLQTFLYMLIDRLEYILAKIPLFNIQNLPLMAHNSQFITRCASNKNPPAEYSAITVNWMPVEGTYIRRRWGTVYLTIGDLLPTA
jgi:hypothetical protein